MILLAALSALFRHEDVFSALITGAADGVRVMMKIFPALVGLLSAVYMLRASGAMDALTRACAPSLRIWGIPEEVAPLVFIPPISGSGALAALSVRLFW
ncbi:MAG: hypothetical protein LBC78_04935 [Oscillospiraceae bacterium]|nr:hypothetical protein [Oscillospiraceae bacterium]